MNIESDLDFNGKNRRKLVKGLLVGSLIYTFAPHVLATPVFADTEVANVNQDDKELEVVGSSAGSVAGAIVGALFGYSYIDLAIKSYLNDLKEKQRVNPYRYSDRFIKEEEIRLSEPVHRRIAMEVGAAVGFFFGIMTGSFLSKDPMFRNWLNPI